MKIQKLLIICICMLMFSLQSLAAGESWGTIGVIRDVNEYITLRELPKRKAAEVDRIPLGEKVVFLGETVDDFSYISYCGQTGYALTEYIGTVRPEKGEFIELSDAQMISFNLYLTTFSRQWFSSNSAFLSDTCRDSQMIDFAVNMLFSDGYDSGTWGQNNARVNGQRVPELVRRYFGKEVTNLSKSIYDYLDGYYYSEETGGRTQGGFSVIENAAVLPDGTYRVSFKIYGEGENWKAEAVCALSSSRALAIYPKTSTHEGIAIIDVNGNPDDASSWILLQWMDHTVY